MTERIYEPIPNELQLTKRAIITGCSIGALINCMNIYFGMKTGWTIGGSLLGAILSFSIMNLFNNKNCPSILEVNISQTAASAAGGIASAGFVSSVPALGLLGVKLTTLELTLWALSVSYIGIFFAVPLRRQMIIIEKLRFPQGIATAETIMAMFAKSDIAKMKSKTLLYIAIIAGLHTLLVHFFPSFGMPPLVKSLGLLAISAWGFKLYINPMMFGAGILIGTRISVSLFIGTLIAWGFIGPSITQMGWVSEDIMNYQTGARGWLLWPGVALSVTDAIMALILSYKSIINSFKKVESKNNSEADSQEIPLIWWTTGLFISSIFLVIMANIIFEIPIFMTVFAIIISSGLSMIATRSTGETDINPIGGMGKIAQAAFGAISPGNMVTNLMAAGITGAGATQAGDMMQDLKTGYLLGASPKKQFKAQLFGITAGVFLTAPIYKLFDSAYEIGSEKLPAPAAFAWKAMAELLTKGFDSLPTHSEKAVIIAAICGVILSLLKMNDKIKPYIPSALAMGISFIIPAYYSIAMFIGCLLFMLWGKISPENSKTLGFSVASGLVAGEGLMGIVTALLTFFKIG